MDKGRPPKRASLQGPILAALVGSVYAFSFFLPVMEKTPGYLAFIYALVCIFFLPMWLANPVFWVGLVQLFRGRWHKATFAGLLALALSLSEVWVFEGGLSVGYYAWVASMAGLALAGWYGMSTHRAG